MPAHYFLGKQLLGTSQGQPMWTDAQMETFSTVFVCPRCGESWARIIQPDTQEWSAVMRTCPRHPDVTTHGCPGSFIHPWQQALYQFPLEVLRYEAALRLNLYEKGYHDSIR